MRDLGIVDCERRKESEFRYQNVGGRHSEGQIGATWRCEICQRYLEGTEFEI